LKEPATWRTRISGVLFVNLATMCWATNAVLGRWLRADIGPLTLTTLRFAVAGLIIQEPVTRRQLAGAIMGLTGVAGLLSAGSLTFLLRLQFNPGDLILVAGAVVWAFYSVFGRRVMRNRSAVSATALSNFISLPLIAAAAALELQHIPVNLRMETIAAIIHICIVPTIIGYWSWNKAVRALGAGGAMVFYNTLPLYGVVMGAALLGEPLGMTHFVFGGLILGGGLWATLGKGSPRS
jgi:drug/metabolite transporter (DMT)-like permease